MTTLTYNAATVTIPDDALWVDEFTWAPVEQRREFTVTGALVVDVAARQAGRPITLRGGRDGRMAYGCMTYSDLATLKTWAAIPGARPTLTLRGVSRTVVFDHTQAAITATPVYEYASYLPGDLFVVDLKFIEV
jgi:hypothetical protein